MPRIFDNIEQSLAEALRETLATSFRSDYCVGYFNLRGWKAVDDLVERFTGGEGTQCRLIVGMQPTADQELRALLNNSHNLESLDQGSAVQLKTRLAEEFKKQLTYGHPTDADEAGLRRLRDQLNSGKLAVKLHTRFPLHAKLYLHERKDKAAPLVGFLGSSNLTMSGLSYQGELNVDVTEIDATKKLAAWFNARWDDQRSLDISKELAAIIDASWAGHQQLPYHIYLKIAYHLSQEARDSQKKYSIPEAFRGLLFEFQEEAVRTAAGHIDRRGGVLLGDVVGLGKTIMAAALAEMYERDHNAHTLIICPKQLVPLWQQYHERFGLRAKIVSLSRVSKALAQTKPYKLVIIDESHNLRNREGSRYRAIREYIEACHAKVILLSATPYNKAHIDLGNQLRLFVEDDRDLGCRPEALLKKQINVADFERRFQIKASQFAAFLKSEESDDWRDLMKLFTVRRTRGYIKERFAVKHPETGQPCLKMPDGTLRPFPTRVPESVLFPVDEKDGTDTYARLFAPDVVDAIDHLELPRYGLGNYEITSPHHPPTPAQQAIIADLSRAGNRLKGFCRTNLFKRLESCGSSFLQSISRHILRNFITLYAFENGLDIPIGTQDASLIDTDALEESDDELFADEDADGRIDPAALNSAEAALRAQAEDNYREFAGPWKKKFKWLPAKFFKPGLADDLRADSAALLNILQSAGPWDPARDRKLDRLEQLIREANGKVLVFTQFSDTAEYLAAQLAARGIPRLSAVTGNSADPTKLAARFSPRSNGAFSASEELDVLIATDVLSEGQNLQDCACVVNFDLPWAIIRLIQRVGRVDRIGQTAQVIRCCTFLPAEGVERILGLRARVSRRLIDNAEVVGTDEEFFEGEKTDTKFRDLFAQKAGTLDDEDSSTVDLGSLALGVWADATKDDRKLAKLISQMPDVVLSTKSTNSAPGVIAYVRTAAGTDALVRLDDAGNIVTQSKVEIFEAARCEPKTPTRDRRPDHHRLVERAVEEVGRLPPPAVGALGVATGPRARTYHRLLEYDLQTRDTIYALEGLASVIQALHDHPLQQAAAEWLRRLLQSEIGDDGLAAAVVRRHSEGKLVLTAGSTDDEPQIICSMGLVS